MRSKLDAFLLEHAVEKGARVHYGEKVTGVFLEKEMVRVETSLGTRYSRLVIGAEGAPGTVSRAAELRDHIVQGLAWEAEIKPPAVFLSTYDSTVFLDWGTFPGGYGWIFPKKDHISVGVGGPASLSKAMMPYYDRFLQSAGIFTSTMDGLVPGVPVSETLSLRSWPIPVRVKKTKFHKGTILVTGDSAGLTDPLTGEGIYYAVRSGKLAAQACLDYLSGVSKTVDGYSDSVNDELMNELTEANRIKALFNTVPLTIHNWVRTSDRAWVAFGKILRGERCYADVRKGFGKYRFLWGVVCWISGIVSSFREKSYLKKT
jgi:flavin-dependent dehydrogenase